MAGRRSYVEQHVPAAPLIEAGSVGNLLVTSKKESGDIMQQTSSRQRKAASAAHGTIARLLATTALGSIIALTGVAPVHAQQAAGAAAVTDETAEVLVTARKRTEKLNDVPAAVNAFTEQEIETRGIVNPRDFIAETPNVTFVETQNVGTSFVIIRGIAQARNSEPSVAVVVDGVQQVNPSQFNQSLFDLEQIEVLKGPQGGLYGRNAIGGAILINTKEPTDSFEFKTKVGGDNGPGYLVQQSASGPISDTLKFVATFQREDTDGYIKNVYLNESADPYRDNSGRLKLLWKPTADLSVDARISFSDLKTTGFYYNIVSNVNDTSLPVQVDVKGLDAREMLDASIKADYNLGFANATSVTAYDSVREIVSGAAYDFKPIAQSYFVKVLGLPFSENQSQFLDVKAISEDLRLTSNSEGFLHWMGGAYLIHTDRFISNGNMMDTGIGVFPVYYHPSSIPGNSSLTFLADGQDNFAYAFYGDMEAELTKQIEAALSLRYDDDDRRNKTDTPTAFLPNVPGFPQGHSGEIRTKSFSAVQPKFTLRYKPEDNTTLYADWGRGFRSGGFNQTGVAAVAASSGILGVNDVFRAEVANTWEVGGKTELWDRKIALDASAYYTTSHNPYFFVYLYANSTQNLGNITQVEYKGFDFNSTFRLTSEWQANAGMGFTWSDITKAVDPTWIGNEAPDVSRYTINAGLQYRRQVTDRDTFTSRLDYQRIGETWWDPQNDTVRNPVNLVNLRMSLLNERFEVALWSKNLFNEIYNAEFSPGGFVFKALPRTFGGDITVWY